MIGEIADGFGMDGACGDGFAHGMPRSVNAWMSHNGYCYDFGIGDYILSPLVHIHCHLALADFKSFLRKGHFYKSCFVVGWSSQKGLADSSGSLVILGDHIEVAATSCSR